MNEEMNGLGVGPKFALLGVVYGAVILTLHYAFFSTLTFTLFSRWVNIAVGTVLIAIGIPLFILSGIMVHTHIGQGKLCTTGVYAYCRHPLYASWVVFVVPGIVVVIGSVVAISWPIFLYILCKVYTAEEEEYLKVKFGDEYFRYEKAVYAIFPRLWRKYR
jgi:protein-S-isoprenylcysteine O-methyltransferase Ste14